MLLIYSMTYELVRKTDTRIHLIVRGDAVRDRAEAPVTGRLAPRQPVHQNWSLTRHFVIETSSP